MYVRGTRTSLRRAILTDGAAGPSSAGASRTCPIRVPASGVPHLRRSVLAQVASSFPSSLVSSVYFALTPELLPPARRAQLLGVVYAAKAALAGASCLLLPKLRELIGRRALYGGVYACTALAVGAFLALRLPETRGRRLDEIWRDLR